MLPKPPLPDAAFATRLADRAEPLLLRQRFRKAGLDEPPPSRKIRVPRGQRPYRVKMIRQDNDGIDIEGIFLPRRGNGRSQYLDVIDKQRLPSLQQIDSEEPASAGDECAAIIRHADRLASAQYASLLRHTGLFLRRADSGNRGNRELVGALVHLVSGVA